MDHNYFYLFDSYNTDKIQAIRKKSRMAYMNSIQSPFISGVSAKESFLIMYNIIKFITLSGHEHVKTLKIQICNE